MSTSPITVRPIASTDHAAWRELWDAYNAFYDRHGETALPEAITAQTWSCFFDERERVHALVAEVDGAVVGLVHYLYHRSTSSLTDVCYLQDLFSLAGVRGRGVGRALIQAVLAHAKGSGASRVYWHTRTDNAIARALYDKVAGHYGVIVYSQRFDL